MSLVIPWLMFTFAAICETSALSHYEYCSFVLLGEGANGRQMNKPIPRYILFAAVPIPSGLRATAQTEMRSQYSFGIQ